MHSKRDSNETKINDKENQIDEMKLSKNILNHFLINTRKI